MYIGIPHQALAISLPHDHLHIDPLLGIADRFGLGAVIDQIQHHIRQHALAASYLVVGIDRMRLLQQVFGNETGHAILQSVAQRLQSWGRDRAHVCWLGGDMFALVLLHDQSKNTAAQAAALLEQFRDAKIAWPQDAHVTVSIGAVDMTASALPPQALITAGEAALQEAKLSGRNTFHLHDTDKQAAAGDKQSLMIRTARQVQYALQNNTLYLVYQPVVCSRTGQVLFYEALARMTDTAGKPIAAAQFMPAVEQFGLSFMLDCRVLRLVMEELKTHPDLQLAINIAASTSEHPAWPEVMEQILVGQKHVATRLIIEITESVQIRDMQRTEHFITYTRSLGGKVALDDFGAGYTTMQHLTGLPIQLMKLDRTLVRDIHNDPKQQEVMHAMLALARSLGLRVVAEGVEEVGEANWLRDAKVDMQQGYHHGHPAADRPWLAA